MVVSDNGVWEDDIGGDSGDTDSSGTKVLDHNGV